MGVEVMVFALAFCFLVVTVGLVRQRLCIDDDDDDDDDDGGVTDNVWLGRVFDVMLDGMVGMLLVVYGVGFFDVWLLGGWVGSSDVVGPSPAVLEE